MKKTIEYLLIAILLCVLAASLLPAAKVFAQCTALQSHICKPETSIPNDYSINQTNNYWTVIGVIPTNPDDKDIHVLSTCSTGALLATSSGTSGIDFIVGDFNHNPTGSYYPQTLYGDASAYYDVYWRNGGLVYPVSGWVTGNLGGSGAGCDMIQIYDIYLESGSEYRFSIDPAMGLTANMALFRNPTTSPFWMGRAGSELEIAAGAAPAYYVAPETDWYGLVVFPIWNTSTPETYRVSVEKLGDCIEMEPDVCRTEKLYNIAQGPANDYVFFQDRGYWSAVSVLPDTLDDKVLQLYLDCDAGGSYLANSASEGVGDTEFIIADFNHTPQQAYYPRVSGGNYDADFSISWDGGTDIFPVPGELSGLIGGTTGECQDIQVWDVYLEAGTEYQFFFYEWGQKDPRLALFRNPGNSEYIVGRYASEFEFSGSGIHNYTAPQSDWYGLVVFANERKSHQSLWQVQINPLDDCVPLMSDECQTFVSWPRDFEFTQTSVFWSAIAVCPGESDAKGLSMFTQCDAKGTNLAYSPATGTSFIVGDFNHTPTGTYYPTVANNSVAVPWDIQSDTDGAILNLDTIVSGTLGREWPHCGLIKIWDVYLESGKTYQFGFTRSGDANIRLALFRNPSNGTYWADRYDAEWELWDSGNQSYSAPADDWYGIVVFANTQDEPGTYTIAVSEEGATGIDPVAVDPERFALYQNAPNPFNPTTVIRYDVPAGGGHVTLAVYDVNGKLVRSLRSGHESAGEKTVSWDARDNNGVRVSSGVYFYRFEAPGFSETRKMVVMK